MYNQFNAYRPQSNLDWIMVQNIGQIEQVAVMPSQKAWVMVQNEPIFALKVADQMGLVTTSMYRFEEYSPTKAEEPHYITREELDSILKSWKEEEHESISKPRKLKSATEE